MKSRPRSIFRPHGGAPPADIRGSCPRYQRLLVRPEERTDWFGPVRDEPAGFVHQARGDSTLAEGRGNRDG